MLFPFFVHFFLFVPSPLFTTCLDRDTSWRLRSVSCNMLSSLCIGGMSRYRFRCRDTVEVFSWCWFCMQVSVVRGSMKAGAWCLHSLCIQCMFFRGLCLVAFAISMFVIRQYNNPTHILSSIIHPNHSQCGAHIWLPRRCKRIGCKFYTWIWNIFAQKLAT